MNVPMKRRFACAFLLAFVGVFSFTLARPESAMVVQPLPSPAGASSTEPQFTIQGDRVILSWLLVAGKRATLKFAERISSGWSVAPDGYFKQQLLRECLRCPFGACPA